MALRRQWFANIQYYCGIQNLDVQALLENVDPNILLADSGYVANLILRLVMSNMGRLTSAKIDWSVIPNTPDQVDQEGAKVGQHLLEHLVEHLDLAEHRLEVALWLDTCGNAFAYDAWDPTKGQVRKFYYDPMTKQPVAQQQLLPAQKQWLDQLGAFDTKNDGEHDFETLSPFDVWMPTRFRRLRQMPWILIRRTFSIDEVYDRWPDKADAVPVTMQAENRLDIYRQRLSSLVRSSGLPFMGGDHGDDEGAVEVDEYWHVPSARVPKGLTICAHRDVVLEIAPHRFAEAGLDTRFPIVDYHNIPVPGRYHAMSTVEHLIGPQQEYNRARQQLIQHRDVLSVPQWMAPIGTLSKGLVRNETGDVLFYNPRIGKPELVVPPPVGQGQVTSSSMSEHDLQMISSFNDASLGQMPQGARSGNAVAMLQERDQLGISPIVSRLEKSFAQLGRHMLNLEWKFRKIPSAIQIYGESRQADLKYFKGSDLNGNTRVTVRPGSMTPKSRAATMELMSQMLTLGVLNPMSGAEKRLVLDALEVGGAEKLFLQEDGSRRRAQIENMMFLKPAPGDSLPDVSKYDDHQAHYEEHLKCTQTDEFELLQPMLKMMFFAHMEKHIGAVAEMAMATAAAQQVSAGGMPGGAPGQSPQAKPLGKASPPSQTSQPKPQSP